MVAGRALQIGSVKQRAILALLALQAGKLVSSETLCELTWREHQPASPAATLQSLVSRLRRALGAAAGPNDGIRGVLLTRDPGWVLDIDADAVDALRFAKLTARARQRSGRGDVAAAAADLADAVGLWRGAALVDIVDAGYLGAHATRLNEARLDAIEDLAEAELAMGQHADVLPYLEEHVEANPLRERAWGLLMITLYRLGRQAAALRAFQQVRAVLAEEVGLEPSLELVEIERGILSHDLALATPSTPPSRPTGDGVQITQGTEFAKYSVIVVEDHDFQRRTMVQLLGGLGVGTVREASNGTEALHVLESGHVPDIIVCDIDMPGMDGVELVERIAESNLACGLVLTSGLESNVLRSVESIGERHGFHVLAAIEKPVTARRLGEVLRQYTQLDRERTRSTGHAPVSQSELRSGLDRGQVVVQFQPRIDLTTGAMSSAEATGLWRIPGGAAVPSSVFLPALARDGLLLGFVERVIADTCLMFDEAARAGIEVDGGMRVAMNVSLLSFSDGSLADRLAGMVRSHDHSPRQFVLELDDVALARTSQEAIAVLTRLRVKGFGLSMRHSGTGPSLTSQLGRVPLTELKLDGPLVSAATSDPAVLAMLESSLASARADGLRVVAGGCDSRATFDALVGLGCSEVLGHFIAEPRVATELVSWMLADSPASV